MAQKEISFQTLPYDEDIQVGYSDNDIVIIDSIQKFADISAAHVSMNVLAFCTQGKAQVTMGGQSVEFHQNQIAILPPDVTFSDIMVSPDFNLKAMVFTNRILQSFLHEKVGIWNDIVYVQRMHIFDMSEDELLFYTHFYEMLLLCIGKGEEHPFRTDVVQALLRSAILGLCGFLKQRMSPSDEVLAAQTVGNHFQRFLDLLHTVPVKRQTVLWYADQLCISAKYLSAICKKQTNKTANDWINEHVMEDIRYQLKDTDHSLKQISDDLGFPNTSFFGKYVKEHFGMTPVQLRML